MERRLAPWWTAPTICVLALGCDPELRTEHRQVRINAELQSYDGVGRGIVEQSTVCTSFTGYRESPDDPYEFVEAEDAELRECYEEQLTGPAEFDEAGCIALGDPGTVTWDLSRVSCDLPDDFGDDQVIFEVLPLSDTRGVFDRALPYPTEVLGFEVTGEVPDGSVLEVGEPLRVIEDRLEHVDLAVVRSDRLERVAISDGTPTAVALEGDPAFPPADGPTSSLRVEARAGDAFQVGLAVPAGELDVGRVDVVARTEIASMSLHPMVTRVVDTDLFLSIGAVAITRDSQGRVLYQPPVEWTVVEGDHELSVIDLDEDGAPDPSSEATIEDACDGARPGETRSVTLEGHIDDFRDTVRVEWDCVGQEETESGCACRSGRGGGALAGWLGLGLLVAWRRRRR